MKSKKRITAAALALIIVLNCFILGAVQSFAHSKMLDVGYDDCISTYRSDGIDEMWYTLTKGNLCRHYSHESKTIKYYFWTHQKTEHIRGLQMYRKLLQMK